MDINFTLILEVLSFLILMAVLTRLIYRPLLEFLDKRSQEVKQMLEQARQARQDSEKNNQTSQELLQAAKNEALKIKDITRQEADKARLLMIEEAKREAGRILQKTKLELNEEVKLAKGKLKKDISLISLEIAQKIIEREIKEEDHKRLIEQALKELSRG